MKKPKTKADRAEEALEFARQLSSVIPKGSEQRVLICQRSPDVNWPSKELKSNTSLAFNKGIYIATASHTKGLARFVDDDGTVRDVIKYHADKNHFGGGLCLMIDDIGFGEGSKCPPHMYPDVLSKKLKPTAIVETSKNNFQYFYFFDKPCAFDEFKAFLEAFRFQYARRHVNFDGLDKEEKKSEDATYTPTRWSRLPCGINEKVEIEGGRKIALDADGNPKFIRLGEDGKPFQVNLKWADYSLRYTLKQICEAFEFGYSVRPPENRAPVAREEMLEYDFINGRIFDRIFKIHEEKLLGENSVGGSGVMAILRNGKARIACPWGEEHSSGRNAGAFMARPDEGGATKGFYFGCSHGCGEMTKKKRKVNTNVDDVRIFALAHFFSVQDSSGGGDGESPRMAKQRASWKAFIREWLTADELIKEYNDFWWAILAPIRRANSPQGQAQWEEAMPDWTIISKHSDE